MVTDVLRVNFFRLCTLKHPALEFHVVPDVLGVNFFRLCTLGPHAMAQMRISALKDVMKLKLEMSVQEKRIREGMENQVKVGKALVIVEEAARRNGFSRFERLQVNGRGRALTGLGDPSPLYMTAFGL